MIEFESYLTLVNSGGGFSRHCCWFVRHGIPSLCDFKERSSPLLSNRRRPVRRSLEDIWCFRLDISDLTRSRLYVQRSLWFWKEKEIAVEFENLSAWIERTLRKVENDHKSERGRFLNRRGIWYVPAKGTVKGTIVKQDALKSFLVFLNIFICYNSIFYWISIDITIILFKYY